MEDHLYGTVRWSRVSARQLREHPLCQYCLERAIVTPAKICVDASEFGFGALRSLCRECHTATRAHIERYGYRLDIGLDGYPLDPRHPFNRASSRTGR